MSSRSNSTQTPGAQANAEAPKLVWIKLTKSLENAGKQHEAGEVIQIEEHNAKYLFAVNGAESCAEPKKETE